MHRIVLLGVAAGLIGMGTVGAAQAERAREIVAYDDVRIEVIAEGRGPLIVMLPGRGRGSEDFDAVAAGLGQSGLSRAAAAAARRRPELRADEGPDAA